MADLPEATTRQDQYLKYIAENGSFSGGGSNIPLPVSIENGGTGATTDVDARTNLGVYSKEEVDSKIQSGGSDITVVQVTGNSETDVMSQKAVTDNLNLKVDKVDGKQLSTEDYTTEEKTKLSGIEAEANKTVIVQTTGISETDVMSQKAVSTMNTIGEGATNDTPSSSIVWGKNANNSSTSNNSVVIGNNSSSDGGYIVNIGYGATSTYNDTVNIGYNANSTNGGLNIGSTATSDSYLGVNLGYGATSSGEGNINIGSYAKSKGAKNVNIGRLVELNGELNVGIGNQTSLGNPNSEEPTDTIIEGTAIGNKATITSNYGVSIGSQSKVQAENSIALGYKSVATEENTVSIGYDSTTRRIVNVTDPINLQDVATKNYVDTAISSSSSGINVVQTTGESTTDVMSQKATTDSLEKRVYNSLAIESSVDLNTKTTAGVYMVDSTCTNTPTYDTDYSLTVYTVGDTSQSDYPVLQICIPTVPKEDTNSSKASTMYIRQKYLNVDTWEWTYWRNATPIVYNNTGESYEDTMSQYSITNNFINKNIDKIQIGSASKASGTGGISIGQNAESYQSGGISIGQYTLCSGQNSIALGANSQAMEANIISVGNTSSTRRISNVTDPTNPQDAATKNYVDTAISSGSSVNVVQTTGASETDVMSQKATTDAVNKRVYNSTEIESGVDLNTKTTSGFYIVDSSSTNLPNYDGSNYSVIVSAMGDTTQPDYPVFQMGIPTNPRDVSGAKSAKMYIRQKYLNVDTWTWTYWLNASVLVQNSTGDSYEDTMSQSAITNNFLSKNIDKIEIGSASKAGGTGGISIGQNAESYQTGGISIGQYTICPVPNSIALGANSQAMEPNVLSIGNAGATRKIINVTNPTNPQDAATKNYVDPVVLYENTSGTTGTITLSDSYTNYALIRVHFVDNNVHNTADFYTSYANRAGLSNTYFSGDFQITYVHACLLSFSDTTATFERNSIAEFHLDGTISINAGYDGIYVTKIVGYKY